jgi:two-component system, NtrC family, nitrogen regulation response regulator GlnG
MTEPVQHRNGTTEILEAPGLADGVALWIEVLNATATPRRRLLTNGAVVLGAGFGADIVIDDPKVSRRHLQLGFVNRKIDAIDLGSRNGTFCNGQRFTRLTLEKDATLQLGNVHVRLVLKQLDGAHEVVNGSEEFGIVGRCERMRHVFRQIGKLSGTTIPALICGESGTGKELVARTIHQRSALSQGPFIVIQCGTLDMSTSRAKLFGEGNEAGAFERANGGTLFLESIGELPTDLQALVMRAVDNETVTRIGEHHDRTFRTRIIAATQRPLGTLVEAGTFRAELSYRFSAIKLDLPPLRDRGEDISLLVHHFAAEFDIRQLPDELLTRTKRYSWPGNVRELRNVLRGYAVLGDLPIDNQITQEPGFDGLLKSILDLERPYHEQKEALVNKFVATYLTELLRRTNGNQSEAAKIAGVERAHLNRMLAKLKRSKDGGKVEVLKPSRKPKSD